ncbi:MAG: hypothetical protein RL563_115 [Pseudomonadota bacterium]|jgi:hypothetical protein
MKKSPPDSFSKHPELTISLTSLKTIQVIAKAYLTK